MIGAIPIYAFQPPGIEQALYAPRAVQQAQAAPVQKQAEVSTGTKRIEDRLPRFFTLDTLGFAQAFSMPEAEGASLKGLAEKLISAYGRTDLLTASTLGMSV